MLIALFGIEFALANDAEQTVLTALQENGRIVDLSFITPTNRGEVLPLLRDIATRRIQQIGTDLPDYMSAKIILLRLADQETIEWSVGEYQKSYGSRYSYNIAEELVWAKQGAIIPHLAPDFFRDDGNKSTIRSTGDPIGIRVVPKSAFSAFTSLEIVAASPQFTAATRDWARQRRNAGVYPFDALRADMRVWWKQNEAAFKAGNYQAVQPLVPEPPGPPPKRPDPSEARRVLPPAPLRDAPEPREATPPPAAPVAIAQTAANPVPSSVRWDLWATLAIVLAGAAGWLFVRSKNKVPDK